MNAKPISQFLAIALLLAASLVASESFAGLVAGHDVLKFSQLPMIDTQLVDDAGIKRGFHGHDELSTAWSVFRSGHDEPESIEGYRGRLMADDFADRSNSPVVSLRWWGSYLNGPLQGVDKFLVTFSADVPAVPGTNSFSHPGATLHSQVVSRGPLAAGSGTFSEQQVYPLSVDGPIYEYCAELHLGKEFHQQPDTVYWLTIAALVDVLPGTDPLTDPNVIRWGWHNRDYTIQDTLASVSPAVAPGEHVDGTLNPATSIWHFQDDAVSGFLSLRPGSGAAGFLMPVVQQTEFVPQQYLPLADGPFAIRRYSKDLAFELYTVPEPTSLTLVPFAVAVAAVCIRGRRPRLTRRPA